MCAMGRILTEITPRRNPFRDRFNTVCISMDVPYTLRILDPWSLMYGEYEEDFIGVLRQRIGPKHPLYNREVYAIAIRRDPEATLFVLATTSSDDQCWL